MAKEMMIVFIYDTSRCRKEEDDPAEAVMYFHPAWVSPTQRLALAGQLMGVYQFLSTSFSPPNLISLQGGKFLLKKLNQYILAIGTDRNIPDWILERRGIFLESILRFFHCDLDTINQSFNNDRNKFTEKLYQMLETYLPILQYSANLFANMPMIKLPKSASNVFLESLQILQYCQETSGIFGGAMFFNNKVVATQLSPELTKQLVITDPYRIKAPADKIPTDFHLPLGVQLIRVYIQKRQLVDSSDEVNTKVNSVFINDNQIKKSYKKTSLTNCGIKRDTSRIFTVPEEGETDQIIPDDVPLAIRRGSLPLKQEIKSKPIRIQHHPLTPSVCSTPLKDVNRILHGTAVLICNATDEIDKNETKGIDKKPSEQIDDIPDVVKEALRCKRLNKLKSSGLEKQEKKTRRTAGSRRSSSVSDLEEIKDNLRTPDLSKLKNHHYTTITDPCYPVFRFDGSPVSQTLYDHYISCHYEELIKEQPKTWINSLKINGIDPPGHFVSFDVVVDEKPLEKPSLDVRIEEVGKKRQETYRRSMSLPLKSLNAPASKGETEDRRKSTSECVSFGRPLKKKLEGLQLTPLMSKLSLLANDDKTSGFCSKDTTPSEYYDLSTLSSRFTKNNNGDEDLWPGEKDSGALEKAELFICGQQSMVMVLLMEDGTGNDPELIHNLWETCMNHLGRLEIRLQHCMEPMPLSENKELYSVLSIDPEWDTLHRSGLWGVTELDIVSNIHDRFRKTRNLTDVIVRTEDTVVYGNQCGKTEIFYQQAVAPGFSGGLPTPADLMGVVPLKAKRRLERDHGIIIL